MKYLRALLFGIFFAIFVDTVGVFVGAVKCIFYGLPVSFEIVKSTFLGVGAKEGALGGVVMIALVLVSGPRQRPPH